ncbi:hypothetical protein KL938_002139 [Ogataea parapolymorpha]|nr:hypothetical protein KL938_002139 [Ogataea parapolymorpha]
MSPLSSQPPSKSATHTDLQANKYIPPWTSPYIIGVAGFSGSGKTTVAQKIIEQINEPWTVLLSMDNFYKPLTPEQRELAYRNEYDFDTPEAYDLEAFYNCIISLKEGKKTQVPVYSFALHNRTDENISIYGANVIIVEGIYSLYDPKVLALMDTKIYVDTDLDICYSRRLLRDIVERKRDIEGIIEQWEKFVKPSSVASVKPTMYNADIVIPHGSDNTKAIDMIIKHIRKQLQKKSEEHLAHLARLGRMVAPINYNNIKVLPKTNQLLGMKSIILNRETSNDDFIFYFDRIASTLISEALELVHYSPAPNDIITPSGYRITDGVVQAQEVVAVNIIKSGDCFMRSLRKIIPEAIVGKVLIQSDSQTGEPQLHTERLPQFSPGCKVLLFDAQVISGAAATMAVKVILDHGVEESEIVLVVYLASETGLRRILNAFPNVKVVVGNLSAVEPKEGQDNDTDWWMSMRFIDARYFGTD